MQKKRISVKVADLTTNKGQLGWLPSNPRQWTQDDVERTKKSLETDPDFLEERPILVIKDGKKWVAFAGNLRTTALKELQPYWDEVGVVQYIPETEEDKHTIKRRAMLDNGSFGAWDFDALANEWDDEPLTEWGVPYVPNVEEEVEKAEKDEEVAAKLPFTEVLGEEHNYIVLYFDNEVDWLQAQTIFDIHAVQKLPTAKGEQTEAFQKGRVGVGRVMNGAKAIEKILEYKEKQSYED